MTKRRRRTIRRRYGWLDIVPAGYYLRSDTWEIVHVPRDEVLVSGEEVVYYRVPVLAVVVGGPIAGLIFLLILPLLVPLLIIWLVLHAAATALRRLRDRVFASPPPNLDEHKGRAR